MLEVRASELRRFAVYVAVGAVNTGLCYLLFALLVAWWRWHHHVALAADYAIGIVLGFLMHRLSTFADRRHLRGAFSKYTLTLVLTFAANFALLDVLVRWELLGPLAAQAVAMTAATLASYAAQTEWVFRSHVSPEAQVLSSDEHVRASKRRVSEATRRAA